MKKTGTSYIAPFDKDAFEQWAADENQPAFFFSDPPPDGDTSNSDSAEDSDADDTGQPDTLPILPVRGLVIYPQTAVPLTIGQPRSIQLIDEAVSSNNRLVGLVASRDPSKESPDAEDLYQWGTMGQVHRLFRAPDGTIRLLIQGLSRFKVEEFTQSEPYLQASITHAPEIIEAGIEIEALSRNARDLFESIAKLIPSIPQELVDSIIAIEEPLQAAYTIANFQRMEIEEAQEILELDCLSEKLKKLNAILTREEEVLQLGQKIQDEARSEIDKVQREYFLREQLKAIQKELGDRDDHAVEIEEFRRKIDEAGMPEEAREQAGKELDRLARLSPSAAEYGVIRTYLDWLVTLPWAISTEDNLEIKHARSVLEEDHFGLQDVKDRIIEFLAIRRLRLDRWEELEDQGAHDYIRREREGVILCFVGPPGVGKTSLGRSIARALNRKFIRTSLGGLRDEAEIRGHRRTYIGAMPGRVIQSLKRIESHNPVFMLDEIDKLGADFRGDPASALLEVLDPEQNSEFRDNYLEVAFDLSQVMFITTANTLGTIPPPLLDRMEIIRIAGYTENEKINIARSYLVPRQLRENGLRRSEIALSDRALQVVIREYTREAGVRNLERQIGSICRKVATRITEGQETNRRLSIKLVREFLGKRMYYRNSEIARRTAIPGVATGLAWTAAGGDILFIEATCMPGGKGFQITGSIGNVMQESARAALSFIRSKADKLGIEPDFFRKTDIHLHVPAGATPKDGPSAGVTMVTALVSLLTGAVVHSNVGMTGEITLRGQVLPVGGIKEKILAAHRAGLDTIILPKDNEADLDELPDEVRNSMKFVLANSVTQVLKTALDQTKIKKTKLIPSKSENDDEKDNVD
jgi:ATP-dependent Lon protease